MAIGTGCRLRITECMYPTTSTIEDQNRQTCCDVSGFIVLIFFNFFTRPPIQQHALPPVGKANCCLPGGNGRLFVLTCSSSLHTATSGDCCSPAAYQCGCLPTVWWACTVLVTFLPHGRRSCWARDLPSLTITYPRSGRFGHPRSGGRDVG